ncbi:MAG TPA: M14 family zinc carboxypeptidase, partial [Candidatus Syntrophosphaera thermopropionivorans]|nr:M14 family zinc carboxypeptidase [Candidatus Syntrophosphaera thermopropionivorans]
MQKRYFPFILIFFTVLTIKIIALPSCYYTYDQISQLLSTYESQYPDIAKKVLIGYSQEDHIPIYAMRITDNVNQDEEEPALLFVGQVHAEEVLGVQITMSNIAEILTNRYQLPYMQWINQLDLWFVPTLNPEGHNVVTSNLDSSYRKNKRDNNMNGIFDFSPQVGYDVDGVDINRNFSFNWVHGDTLFQPGGLEVWDYYRGPAPMSESENQAIKELADRYKFIYSICWHSSRTGNLSEKCYYSFNWKNVRPSPDLAFSASIASGIASHIIKETGTGTYDYFPNLSRQGA